MSTAKRAIAAFTAMKIPIEEELAGLQAGIRFRTELRNGQIVDVTAKAIEFYETWLTFANAEIAALAEHET